MGIGSSGLKLCITGAEQSSKSRLAFSGLKADSVIAPLLVRQEREVRAWLRRQAWAR